jgi:hypothetical protein
MRAALVTGLLVTMLVLGLAAADRLRLPSPVIFPAQRLPLSFSHAEHLRLEIGCGDCHEYAARSRRAVDNNLPGENTCAACHEIDRARPDKEVAAGEPDARCDSCHPGWDGTGSPPRLVVPAPNLKFNHEAHAQRGIGCRDCHGDLLAEGVGLATRAQLPLMPRCLECHDGQQAPAGCTTCHISERDGRVRTDFPEGRLVPSGTLRGDAHDARFRTEHARVAQNDEGYCASCHVRSFCLDCHDGVVKPMDFHVGDYVNTHAVDARRGAIDCGACHRLQTFCTGCHARGGVAADPRTTVFERPTAENPAPSGRFHPPGWVAGTSGGGILRAAADHSFQAQRNVAACASCHREDFCKACHGAVNPHPAGFGASARCRALADRSGRMCLRCHTDLDSGPPRCD